MKLSGLGRGLESLIPKKDSGFQKDFNNFSDNEGDLRKKDSIFLIEVDKIKVNTAQPRRDFNEEELNNLAQSIREHGILQPLIVTKTETESPGSIKVSYELIAGERRLKAARIAGLSLVPVIIRAKGARPEKEKLELALVENIQRENLNAMEKARAYEKLSQEFDLSQKEIAQKVGQSREAIANTMRLLQLPSDIQRVIAEGKISEGHARAILALENENQMRALLAEIMGKSLSVRAAESLARQAKGVLKKVKPSVSDPELKQIESQLEEALGTRVKLAKAGSQGRILIEFYSEEELGSILNKILKA